MKTTFAVLTLAFGIEAVAALALGYYTAAVWTVVAALLTGVIGFVLSS